MLAVGVIAALAGCEPSPESFGLTSMSSQPISGGKDARSVSLVEGDVFVFRSAPLDDDDDEMNLCVTAKSSAPSVIEVRRVQGQCRVFVAMAKAGGSATVTFEARDGSEPVAFSVRPLP